VHPATPIRAATAAALTLLFSSVPRPLRAAPPPDAGERAVAAAAAAVIKKHGLKVCRAGVLRRDRQQEPGYFVFLRRSDDKVRDLQVRYALFARAGKLWAIEALEDDAWRTSCPGTGTKTGKREELNALVISDLVDPDVDLSITFFGRELVVLDEKPLAVDGRTEVNWVDLVASTTANSAREGNHDFEAANVLVLPEGSAAVPSLPTKTRTFVTHGRTTGPRDADLDVRAWFAAGAVKLAIDVIDDKDVPLPRADAGDTDLLKSDHLEIWLAAGLVIGPSSPGKTTSRPTGNPLKARQLGVARLAGGGVHARWLAPPGCKDPLPKVSAPAPGKFVIEFPAPAIFGSSGFAPEIRHEVAFTAAFSDADESAKKQKALVATSELAWGDVGTFGNLIWLQGGGRFPPLPTPANEKLKLTVTGN
jgi:hypothetical protein